MSENILRSRAETEPRDRWNLTPLFAADAAWEELLVKAKDAVNTLDHYRGRLAESAKTLADAIVLDNEFTRMLDKLVTYAHLRRDEDLTDNTTQSMYQRVLSIATTASEKTSFFLPELLSIDDKKMETFLNDSALADYRFSIEKTLRGKPHVRSEEIETILASASEVHRAPSEIFSKLADADFVFGTVRDDKGTEIELTHASFQSLLTNQSPALRKKAFHQYYSVYNAHRETIAASLAASIRTDRFYAKVRNHSSCRSGSLFSDKVDESVYDNLIATVRKNISPLVEYLNIRKKALGLDELHIYDTYVPLSSETSISLPYDEAVAICADALAPLGKEYVETMRDGLQNGWVDRYENRGKRSGAYSSGCYDSSPYILMNYRSDSFSGLYTLIHEAGHSMHSHLSHKNQPYHYADYAIFVAEVASTTNEILLSHHLLQKHANNPEMKKYILTREIDDIRSTLIRQTMFAEFEHVTHAAVEKDEPLTLEFFRSSYRSLLEAYFGGGIILDDVLDLECLRIPHFYHAFYVYKYATGISAAVALAEGILSGDAKKREAYLQFLSLGGSKYPLDALKVAGIDMTKQEPIEKALGYFSSLVNQLKA